MVYIPDDWLNDKRNEEEVTKLIEEDIGCIKPIDYDPKKVEDRLKELGELKILEKLKKGAFSA